MILFRPKLKLDRQLAAGPMPGGQGPTFGALFASPAAAAGVGGGGFTARILEFSSPQITILSPTESPLKRKPSLITSPMPPPSRYVVLIGAQR